MQLTKHWAVTLDDYVIDLGWSPDGNLLAAASAAGPITIAAAADGAVRHVLPGHEDGANCLAWSFREPATGMAPLLATGGQDGKVKLWDVQAGQAVAATTMPGAWVEHLAWRTESDGRPGWLAAAASRNLQALNPDGSVLHAFPDAPKSIAALAWEPRGGCLATAYFGGVSLWDADEFDLQKELPYNNGIHALVWSPDGRWLVSGDQDPSVHLWIPGEDVELHMSGYEGKVKELSFDSTSRRLATGGGTACCLWDCSGAGPEGREPTMLPHQARVCAVAFQNAGGLLATAAQDGQVIIWDPGHSQPARAAIKMPAAATGLVWSPNDRQLAIGSTQGIVYVLKCEV